MSLASGVRRELTQWTAPNERQDRLRQAFLAHLCAHPDALWREGPPEHLTASALVFNPAATRVALTLHRKGQFWVQFGGHLEPGDTDLAAAAVREAREESGIADVRLLAAGRPLELNRHTLPAAFGRCREHLDVRYVLIAPDQARTSVSTESDDVAWWPVDDLPTAAVPDLPGFIRAGRVAVLAG